MEKDNVRHYRAYEGFKPANNGNTSSLKRSTSERGKTHPSRQVRCLCFGGVPDKASQHSFLKGCIINFAICGVLLVYTLLGSLIFLAIEGGSDVDLQQQRTLATSVAGNQQQTSRRNTTAWLKQVSERARRFYIFKIRSARESSLFSDSLTSLTCSFSRGFVLLSSKRKEERVQRTLFARP